MDSATTRRRPCFLDINDGLTFLAETEMGFEQPPHFLDSCFLCNKPLAHDRDIFMYRGDIPFCSEECRQQQIDMDEAKDKKINVSASIKALREKDHINSNTTQQFHLRRDRVVAA